MHMKLYIVSVVEKLVIWIVVLCFGFCIILNRVTFTVVSVCFLDAIQYALFVVLYASGVVRCRPLRYFMCETCGCFLLSK